MKVVGFAMNEKDTDELENEFVELSNENASPLLNFSVASGMFGEVTVKDFNGTVVHIETAVGVNMNIDTATLIKLYRASSSFQEITRRD